MTTRILFWFQVVMAWIYTIPQVISLVEGKTKGLNLTMYAIFIAYIFLSLSLAIASYRNRRDKTRKQTIIIFIQWFICIGLILGFGINKIIWTKGDTIISSVVLVLSLCTALYFKGLKNPYSKGFMAVWCKAMPQVWLAYTIFLAQSGDGLPLITLFAGHLTSIPRLLQITIGGIQGGWDKPTKGLMLGESANVFTWIVVTIVWLIY